MRVRPRARRSTRVLLSLYVYYMNHNEYTQQAQQGHPRRARHPLALEGHRNPDRSATLAPLMALRSKRRLAHMAAQRQDSQSPPNKSDPAPVTSPQATIPAPATPVLIPASEVRELVNTDDPLNRRPWRVSACMYYKGLQRVYRQAPAGHPRPARCPFDTPKSIVAQVRTVTERPDGAPFQAPAWSYTRTSVLCLAHDWE